MEHNGAHMKSFVFYHIDQYSNIHRIQYYSPIDVDWVNSLRTELGHLPVSIHPVLLVYERSSGVGGKAAPITNADKVSCEAVQLELSLTLLIGMNPGLTKVDDVGLEEGGVDPQVCHVWTQPGNVEWCHPDVADHKPVPLSRILVDGSKNCNIKYLMCLKNTRYHLKFKYLMKFQIMRYY